MIYLFDQNREPSQTHQPREGFTLIELLVVVAVIALLAALLLPALSQAKAKARRIECMNHLHQMGIALQLYVNDYHKYPFYLNELGWGSPSGPSDGADEWHWQGSLQPYYKTLWWTNRAYQCPGFQLTSYGDTSSRPDLLNGANNCSYAYNIFGTDRFLLQPLPPGSRILGLGAGLWTSHNGTGELSIQGVAVSESAVMAPSEMFAMTDSRVFVVPPSSQPWAYDYNMLGLSPLGTVPHQDRGIARHGQSYNVARCDGQVTSLKRLTWLDPRKTGQNWNNDHDPHPETWSQWVLP